MVEPSKQFPRTVWLGMSLAFGMLGLGWFVALIKMAHTPQAALPVISQIADFTLTNQDGKITTLADLTNRVWIADIIFTRCAGPCPRMTGQMESLQAALPPASGAKLVTLTTDPGFDTPPVMKKYGERFNADFNRWTFLSGTKAEIAALAAGSLKLSAVPVKPADQQNAADLFIHTTIFVVVDKHAQLRAIFETGGDGVDWAGDVEPRLLKTIARLEREP
jgi:protein SCO1/2